MEDAIVYVREIRDIFNKYGITLFNRRDRARQLHFQYQRIGSGYGASKPGMVFRGGDGAFYFLDV